MNVRVGGGQLCVCVFVRVCVCVCACVCVCVCVVLSLQGPADSHWTKVSWLQTPTLDTLPLCVCVCVCVVLARGPDGPGHEEPGQTAGHAVRLRGAEHDPVRPKHLHPQLPDQHRTADTRHQGAGHALPGER